MSLSSRNETVITQSAQITANTGGNVANRNIAYNGTAGGISTGAIGVQVQFLADLSKNKTVVYPKTINNNYIYPTSAPIVSTEPTPEPKQWASSYHNVATPARRTRPVSYTAASGPLVMGTSTTRVPGKAASQNAPLMQTVQAGIFDTVLSHLLVVIITLLVVAGRKPVHI
jgi:hypothetical protein